MLGLCETLSAHEEPRLSSQEKAAKSDSDGHILPSAHEESGSQAHAEATELGSGCDGHDQFPLRVLHIAKTLSTERLSFHEPRGWDFHVVSHTWSQGLRDLSKKIGKVVHDSGSHHTYEQAFLDADLGKEPCFEALLQFLRLLSADRVDAIWIDALCINQTDMEEKSREISRMAGYYKNTKGCYVLTHGIDQGYEMWKNEDEVPRWFNRVWTLQEFLLPKELFFIVTDYNPRTIATVNRLVCEYPAPFSGGACKCIFNILHTWSVGDQYVVPGEYRFIMGTRECERCKSATLIRELHMSPCCSSKLGHELGKDEMQLVYIVDGFAYLMLAVLELKRTTRTQKGNLDLEQLISLERQLSAKEFSPKLIIGQIGQRECSVEEDRVLSILGLLNAQHTRQLRAGKKLREQVIDLAKAKLQAGDQDFLIQMMTMHSKGCYNMGPNLSWAPNFNSSEGTSDDCNTFFDARRYKRCVEVQGITAEGKVMLDGVKIAQVRMRVLRSAAFWFCGFYTIRYHDMLYSHSSHGGFTIEVKNLYSRMTKASTFEFDAWFLLLATTTHDDSKCLALMCLKNNDAPHTNDLHKIGLLRLDSDQTTLVFRDSAVPRVSCTLGGSEGCLEDGCFNCNLSNPPALDWTLDRLDDFPKLISKGEV